MKFSRRAGRRDAIESDIIKFFRSQGLLVVQLDTWDLQVCDPQTRIQASFEVKTGNRPLTKSQDDLIHSGWPLWVLRSLDDARSMFAAVFYRKEEAT